MLKFRQPNDQGLNIIEFSLLLTILGILTAIAIPSFLNVSKESDAKSYVDAINRAQEAYYEKNGQFATSVSSLVLDISKPPAGYQYTIESSDPFIAVVNIARPQGNR